MRVLVIFFTSKLIRCFVDDFTFKMKSKSIAYVLNGIDHILDTVGS